MWWRGYEEGAPRAWSRVLLSALPLELPDPGQQDVEERDAVRTALAYLGPRQRAVLVLRFFCDLSVEDTAAALNCSTGNVKSQTARDLATLRRLLPGAPGRTELATGKGLAAGKGNVNA